jgi:Flp pilus assembly CpaF family ATPase
MAKKQNVKFNGIEIELGGETYILPPLPIKAYSKGDASAKIQHIQNEFEEMAKDSRVVASQEATAELVTLVTMALARNYPQIDENLVEEGCADIMVLFSFFQYLISQSDEMKARIEEARKNELRAFVEKMDK